MSSDSCVLVAGASGFVGRRLVADLVEAGRDVRAMTRRPERHEGPGTPVRGDVHEPDSLTRALEGCAAAYYLVHSLGSADFERLDAEAATAFGQAAREAGVRQIVYLGGLGSDFDELSAHLRSRREVEGLLGSGGVPVTVLRAGIVVGARRHLLGDDPPARASTCPRWSPPSGSTPGRSRSPSPTWCATSSVSWTVPRRSTGSSRSADRRCSATPTCSGGWRGWKADGCRSCRSRC